MNSAEIKMAIDFCIKQVDAGIKSLGGLYPESASVGCIYRGHENIDWTNGFWTGMLWLAYEFTSDEKYKTEAMKQVKDFHHRIVNRIEVEHHDMGFLYLPSCVAAYKMTGDETAKEAALLAADKLCERFQEKGQFIQAWGELGARDNYRLIIDCLLNIPLLFWAADITGNENYRRIAMAHLNTAVKVAIREDGSTFHTYFMNPETGEPDHGETHQGYSDDSIWARGQAWGIYGLAIAYKYTKDSELTDKFLKVTNVFFEHLPTDNVPAWDMIFTDTKTQKDTSAVVIAVCGILEMSKNCKLPEHFLKKADDMMAALQKDYYTCDIPNSNGILKHAVYAMKQNIGVDECNIWGDYYYMEALMRYTNPKWDSYWG